MERIPHNESLPLEEVSIPKETRIALENGIKQLVEEPTARANEAMKRLEENRQMTSDQERLMPHIQASMQRFIDIVEKLGNSKEVKLVSVGQGNYDFQFSEEQETEKQPVQPGEIIIDESSTPKLSQLESALQHNFNNPLFTLLGASELIGSRAERLIKDIATSRETEAKDIAWDQTSVWFQTGLIHQASREIVNAVDPIQTATGKLRISTDAGGKTTITPIPRFVLPSER